MSKNYDEASVVRSLSRKNGCKVNPIDKTIQILKDNTDIGNGSWGKIDYLHKVHGYFYTFVNQLQGKVRMDTNKDKDDNAINKKVAKRESKLNMAAMTKAAMKKAKSK